MLTTASKHDAGNGIDWASPHTNAKPGASRCRLHNATASGEKSIPVTARGCR